MKVRIIPFVLLIFSVSIALNAKPQDCVGTELAMEKPFQRLQKLLDAHEGNVAFVLADSMWHIMETENLTQCDFSNWIKYYKAVSLLESEKFVSAVELLQEILKNEQSNQQWELLARCHIKIGLSFEVANLPQKCKSELEIARKIINEHHLTDVQSLFAVRYSSYHRIYENIDSAKYYAKMAVERSTSITTFKELADGYYLLAVLETDPIKSIEYEKKSIEAFIHSKNYFGASLRSASIAYKYLDINQYDKHLSAIDSSFKYIKNVDPYTERYFLILNRLYNLKLNYFHTKGLMDSVNRYTILIKEAKEKERSFVNQGKIESNFIDFALANEKAKSDTIKKNNTYLRYGLIIISSLLLIIFWLFYRNIIQIKKIKEQYFTINNKNLDLNELLIKQNVLLSEVHHRVKNNLQLVISMITVLSKKLTGEDQIQLLRDVTNKIHSMALIHEQLYKKNDFDTIELGEYFNELAENFKSIQAKDFTIAISLQPDKIKTNIETAIPLGVILTELISNSLKYVSPTDLALKINIDLTYIEQKYIIKYSDNGKGYHQDILEQQTGSMGFSIIKNMTRQLQAESKFYNENGAVYSMVFKQKNTSQIITNP